MNDDHYKIKLVRLKHAITDALRETEKSPNDSVHDIWNDMLSEWKTGYRLGKHYQVEQSQEEV